MIPYPMDESNFGLNNPNSAHQRRLQISLIGRQHRPIRLHLRADQVSDKDSVRYWRIPTVEIRHPPVTASTASLILAMAKCPTCSSSTCGMFGIQLATTTT